MQLDGMHHITMITGDAQRNVDFYADLLGLRMVKKTVNFDAPEAYHLYFGDERGSPGTILTWFEFAGARPGRAGAGMIYTIQLGVPSEASLDFWQARLDAAGYSSERSSGSLKFADYDGLGLELVIAAAGNTKLQATHPEVPADHAITGVEGARAYIGRPVEADAELLTTTLGFVEADTAGAYRLEGPHPHLQLGLRSRHRTRHPGGRHRPPHRLALDRRRPRGLAAACRRGRLQRHSGDRSRLLQRDLLPPAAGHPL